MLILSRNIGQRIMIGDNIVITVLGVSARQARIGIDCPREIPVHREEVVKRIQEEKGGINDDDNGGNK